LTVARIPVDGPPIFTAFIRDITQRQQAEEALRRSKLLLGEALEERERIFQDLHDGLIQSVYAIGLNLKVCQRLLSKDPTETQRKLGSAIADLNVVIRKVRNFVKGLSFDQTNWQGLENTLASLIRTMEGSHAMQFVLQLDPTAATHLTPEQSAQIVYIAQEAMSNSLRHSRAKTGVVSLQKRERCVRFQIGDDGIGFDPNTLEERGHGLHNMNARARKLDAEFTIISQPGCGTRVVLDIPLERSHAGT